MSDEGDVVVQCPCGRRMRRAWSQGHGEYRCGCGAGVHAEPTAIPSAARPGFCPVWIGGTRCGATLPRRQPPNPFTGSPGVRVSREDDLGICPTCAERILTRMLAKPEFRAKTATIVGRREIAAVRKQIAWDEFTEREAEKRRREVARREREADMAARAVHVVYYVRLGVNHIKIGTTGRLAERMGELRVVNAENLLAIEPGTYDLEQQRHVQFDGQRYDRHREDFAESTGLLDLIGELREKWGDPYEYVKAQLAERRVAS